MRWITWEVNVTFALWVVFIYVYNLCYGIIAGFFPARILSGFQPIKAFKRHDKSCFIW
jgi:ABC-type lipoprotein release transport system permease subunit